MDRIRYFLRPAPVCCPGPGRVLAMVVLLAGYSSGIQAADLVMEDFVASFDLARPQVIDGSIERATGERGIRVRTGHREPWPGITLAAPGGNWDLGAFGILKVDLRNAGTNAISVSCRVDNEGADGVSNCLTRAIELAPGKSGQLQVPLERARGDDLGKKLFGMRGYPSSAKGGGSFNPSKVRQLILFVDRPKADHVFEVTEVRATGRYTPPTACVTDADPFFPFIDTFGQYRHRDWPGKVKSPEDLQAHKAREAEELAAQPGPADWDEYGGAGHGPQLKATGFFRTEKRNGKWWLVDPAGHLFFSHGVDCAAAMDSTPVEGRENWFVDFPGDKPEYAGFLSRGFALKGHYADHSPKCFSFAGANLYRKYGTNWPADYRQLVHRRLRSWGMNTIANWSDAATRRLRRTAYTDAISSGRTKPIAGSEGYWGKFPDVYDSEFEQNLRWQMQAKLGDSAGDSWCIGYFSDNEMSWGDETSLALGALLSPANQPAKQEMVRGLQAKYQGVEQLNRVWGSRYASWQDLLDSQVQPDQTRAAEDLKEFYTRTAERYFRTVREVIRAVAPNQLYLGCRFAWVNARAAKAAAKYCDVVSYNLYLTSVADFQFNGGADVPLIIGEFHFGALDRGLFHTGLVRVPDQAARAAAYRDYVLGALRHPQFVGCHWFQYFDEPTTGRSYDEENYQIGLVDIADTPYAETIAACREVGRQLYAKP